MWRPGRSPQELLDALRSAGEETERLVQLSEDVLVVARADGGGLPVRQGPIDLGQALSELSWRFTPRFAAADRELSVEVEEGNGVSADRMRLEQAIGNLLRSSTRSPAPMAARPTRATAPGVEPTSGSCCHSTTAASSPSPFSRATPAANSRTESFS